MTMETLFITGIAMDDPGGTGSLIRSLKSAAEQRNLPWRFEEFSCRDDELLPGSETRPIMLHLPFRFRLKRFFLEPKKMLRKIFKRLTLAKHFFTSFVTRDKSTQSDNRAPKKEKPLIPDQIVNSDRLVLFHPQAIGYQATLEIFRQRKKSHMYVLDSSFFCRASYNHVKNESSACLKCLGGDTTHADALGCINFPHDQLYPGVFESELAILVREQKVHLLAQCESQKALIVKHFGETALSDVVGIYADYDQDWRIEKTQAKNKKCRLVFHGNPLPAKGAIWAINLARVLSDIDFIFPCYEEELRFVQNIPKNVIFRPCTWSTGLKNEIEKADAVLCPSLWSAPIEGALVKSLASGKITIVVNEKTGYQSELEAPNILRVDADIDNAAKSVLRRLEQQSALEVSQPFPKRYSLEKFIGNVQAVLEK